MFSLYFKVRKIFDPVTQNFFVLLGNDVHLRKQLPHFGKNLGKDIFQENTPEILTPRVPGLKFWKPIFPDCGKGTRLSASQRGQIY